MSMIKEKILIDGLYINESGGLVLLLYLSSELEKNDIVPYYIIDSRCANSFLHIPDCRKNIMTASMRLRHLWYKKNASNFDLILCFGNIPPSIKLDAVVYTYFHNINLLSIPISDSIYVKFQSVLKRKIFKLLKKNTNYWIVQTENTCNELIKHLCEDKEKTKIIPFYNITGASKKSVSRKGYIYASNYTPQKNFEFVVSTWKKMAEIGFAPTLHLTLNNAPQSLIMLINSANNSGANIINHGRLNHEDLFSLYRRSKAIVYAATNESLGLCLIEAIENGCDVIAPDLPYVHCICKPSYTFELGNEETLYNSIRLYESNEIKSTLVINNGIKDIINIFNRK